MIFIVILSWALFIVLSFNCWQNAPVINLTFKNDRNVFVSEDRTHSAESLPSKGDTTFDLLFHRGGTHENALIEIDVLSTSSISLLSSVVGSSMS